MLYGISLYFGLTGTGLLQSSSTVVLPVLVPLLIVVGLCFKLGAWPMHFWVLSVYKNMPIAALAYLSTGVKLATWVLVYRLYHALKSSEMQIMLGSIALISIVWGNAVALSQRSLRGLMAYSSVAYAGLFMLPILVPETGSVALLFGSAFYMTAQYALFFALHLLEQRSMPCTITSYQELSSIERRLIWLPMCLGLLALSGLPPWAGFTTKLSIFFDAYRTCSKYFFYFSAYHCVCLIIKCLKCALLLS